MKKIQVAIAVSVAVLAIMVSGISVYAGDTEKININTASADELTQLHGVGPKYAAKIVAYRDQNGPFASPEDIMKVSGIGQKTFEKNKELITVE
ncbi:Transcription accessory protein (S1 RNA-binding domain) [Olavius sp. associated proteobacterium Delta 1]|nr:Transcription accessory protein (S1 RNA-binding domain) [Olavius sp. associated proteobacterium Delta 1]